MRFGKYVLLLAALLFTGLACQFTDDLGERFLYRTPTMSNTLTGRFVVTATPMMTNTTTSISTPEWTESPTSTETATFVPTGTITQTGTLSPSITWTGIPAAQTSKTPVPIAGTGSCNGTNSAVEASVLSLINSQRSSAGLNTLSNSTAISDIARNYSKNMAENSFFGHGDIWSRVNAAGAYSAVGEILYAGMGPDNSPAAAVNAWLNSLDHREKLLNPVYTMAGVGYWCDPNSTYGGYYTVDFARP